MTESTSQGSTKNIGKVLQRTVTRTKEKVLRNLGKADQTKDDDFERNVTNFNDQQIAALKLQKELKHYSSCLKEMSMASNNLHKTVKEVYDCNWTGYTEFCAAQENIPVLWEDYLRKINDEVNVPLNNYIAQFPDLKMKIAKRNRKLTDYDSARHNQESISSAKKIDDAKVTKAMDELNEARQVYETINSELHEELPNFYYSRVNAISLIVASLFSSEVLFQMETAKMKSEMEEAACKLNKEIVEYRPRLISENRPIRVESMSEERYVDVDLKSKQHNNTAITTSEENHADLNTSQDSNASVKSVKVDEEGKLNNANSIYSKEVAVPTVVMPTVDRTSSKVSEVVKVTDIATIEGKNENENEALYDVPQRVLFKVQATHQYIGDDIDELSFEIGEIIDVVPFEDPEEQDEGWLTGIKETTREKGVFPENFTKRI